MKKARMIMAVTAIILGMGSAFAFKTTVNTRHTNNQDYYAVSADGTHFTWETTPPANYSCQSAKGTCEISSATTPPSNGYPPSYTVLQGVDKDSAYMPN